MPANASIRSPSAKKGKTYTVLFKSDRLQQHAAASIQQRDAMESPMLQRVGSQDEKVGQVLESARYLDGGRDAGDDPKSSPRIAKPPSKVRKLHQISI